MKKYKDLTKEEKDRICNGCGAKGGRIKPPLAIFFNASCNHHDYGYWLGGTEEDRLKCDKKLYDALLLDCSLLPRKKYLLYRLWSKLYYYAVRAFGSKYFNYKT